MARCPAVWAPGPAELRAGAPWRGARSRPRPGRGPGHGGGDVVTWDDPKAYVVVRYEIVR
ncbi:hypothetical protein HBB16_11020 [Pseudonocardia sp. MCCB 268]|nr:hypothetical protein [Pseudonocardia cytotoxica]